MTAFLFVPMLEFLFCALLVIYYLEKRPRLVPVKFTAKSFPYMKSETSVQVTPGVEADMDKSLDIENIKLKPEDYRKIVDGAVQAVSLVVGSRDPYTAGHQRRVAEIARAIAVELKLSRWQTRGVYIAGLLHDVGKWRCRRKF
jgi:HD-GYP domain-containing protein (c-di-GMP phosphodiesterase class II)